jgi:hypothetical protein
MKPHIVEFQSGPFDGTVEARFPGTRDADLNDATADFARHTEVGHRFMAISAGQLDLFQACTTSAVTIHPHFYEVIDRTESEEEIRTVCKYVGTGPEAASTA